MNILGIDYGRKKVGLAISSGKIAFPLEVIRYEDRNILFNKIKKVVKEHKIQKMIVGISESKTLKETIAFISILKKFFPDIKIEETDETLSTYQAIKLSQETKISRKKLKQKEDAYAACVILQSFLEKGKL